MQSQDNISPPPVQGLEASDQASSAVPGLTLEQYNEHIVASGISFEVAKAYGVRGIDEREVARLGFSREQTRKGLLLPLYWSDDEVPDLHQLRPWVSRISPDGKPIKYETPAGHPPILARYPGTFANVYDPRAPLIITEGVKKLLSWETKRRRLRAEDLLRLNGEVIAEPVVVSLMGVRGWMGPNEYGGVGVPLAAIREVPFRGRDADSRAEFQRKVILAFDSDAMTKPEVHAALRELRDYLTARGASVWVMYLASGPDGAKQGLDDFLASGHSLQDALNSCEAKLRPMNDTPSLLRFADLLSLPALPWVLRDLLIAEGVTILYGPFASYKSFVLLDWLACVAGRVPDWFGMSVERHGPCVYIYSEGRSGIGQRANAVKMARRLEDDIPLYVLPSVVDMTSQRAVGALIALIRTTLADKPPVAIAIDTVSRNMPAKDANAPVDMNAFVAGCDMLRRTFGCQVIAVHHPNKEGGMRGTLDLPNNADTIIRVARINNNTARLTIEKQKDADHGAARTISLRPEADSLVVSEVVLAQSDAGQAKTKQLPVKRHLMLRELATTAPKGLSFGDWLRAAEEAGVSASTFKGALKLFEDDELTRKDADGKYGLTSKGAEYARAHGWSGIY